MNQITLDLSLLTILDVLSIATSFMFGLLFITAKTKNRKANIFLGLFLWSLGVEVFNTFLGSNEFYFSVFQTSLFTVLLLFLYVNTTLNQPLKWWVLLLFIPGIWVNFIAEEIDLLKYFEYVFNIILLALIFKKTQRHKEKLTAFYSDIEYKTLSWIKTIVSIFLFFHVLWIIEDIVGLKNEDWTEHFIFASNVLTFFMIYWIGYNGFSQQEMFASRLFYFDEKKEDIIKTDLETEKKFKEISVIIQEKKLFTNTNLNLRTLANQLNLKEKELSKLINIHTDKNFYHFVNQFRVAEFKKLLLSPKAKQLSLLGLAEEAGFSSKSTFYNTFKVTEGITPKQYQNQIKKSE